MKIALLALCAALLCVFSFSAYKIISTLRGYKQAEEAYNKISSQVVTVASPTPTPELSPDVTAPPEKSPIDVDFAALKATSDDAVGWIYQPNTVINYPIAHTEDNYYYLDHILGGEPNGNGTIFIDVKCAGDFSDKNTLVYGHNMNDGSMFASLRNYRDPAYYPDHPVLYISTPDKNYRLELFTGFVTEPTSFAYANSFDEVEQFEHFIDSARELSVFETDVEVTTEDRLVTLSTCTYEFDDARFVVIGKLVEIL